MWLLPQIFVRAFDSDERLVGVAFMDVGVYVTSLQTLKNLLLIGDAVKSVSFVAFQVRSTVFGFENSQLIFLATLGGPVQACATFEGHSSCLRHQRKFLIYRR